MYKWCSYRESSGYCRSLSKPLLSIADKIVSYINNNEDTNDDNCIDYIYRAFKNPYPNIIFDRTMTNEIENIIKSLEPKNLYRYTEIPVKIRKTSCPFITAPLNDICKRSVLSGSFPTRLKYSVIKPLLKSGDKTYKYYRPISLLTSFSKIFEKNDIC
jgi:hypothetical protein